MGLCMRCMTETGNEQICPICGFDQHESCNVNPTFLQPGTMLNNRYIVGLALGQGGFGITYIGYDNVLNTRVAIKEYYPSDIAGRTSVDGIVSAYTGAGDEYGKGKKRFLDEARILAKFSDHPCIVGVKDCFEENSTAYMIMEFLEGISLKEYLKRKGGKLSAEESISLLTPVMDALRAVHGEGIIHRDISPDNIFVTTDGRVRLIDFGAARQSIGGQKSLSVMLKPGYAPEEQYRSKGNQGPWTDVYALTATLYRMITGKVPPDSLERVMDDTLEIPMDLPEHIKTALMIGMAVRVPERYRSVEQLQSTLLNISVESNVEETVTGRVPTEKPHKIESNGITKIWITAIISATIVIVVALILVVGLNNRTTMIAEVPDDEAVETYVYEDSEINEPTYEEVEEELEQDYFDIADLYNPNLSYNRMVGIENSVFVTSRDEYEDVKTVIENGFESYSEFVASRSRDLNVFETYMFPYMYTKSNAFESQWEYFIGHNITSYDLNFCEVESLRKRDDTYYAWVFESATETKDGKVVSVNSEWVYRLKITNRGILIFDYTERP